MRDQIHNQYIGIRQEVKEIFLDAHGTDQTRSVSLATSNAAGTLYWQVPAGTILAKWEHDGMHYPCVYEEVATNMGGAGKTMEVTGVAQFREGDFVKVPDGNDDANSWRQIQSVDLDNDEITVDGADVNLSAGDALRVNPSRSYGEVDGSHSSTQTIQLHTGEADRFEVGDTVDIGTDTGLNVDAVDTGADTIDVDSPISPSDGDHVVSDADGSYKVCAVTQNTSELTFTPQNVLAATRSHGEVREANIRGLLPEAKTALHPMITFSQTTN